MQNKKLILTLSVLIVFAGAAAFIAGKMFNRGVSPPGSFGPEGDGISILPAEELPETPSEAEGLYVGRQDNIIRLEADPPVGDGVSGSPVGIGGGPQVDVVITTATMLYRDTTQPPSRPASGNDPRVLQQTVEAGTLDDLIDSQSLVRVWGHRSGDRVIAEVLVYSNLVYLQKP